MLGRGLRVDWLLGVLCHVRRGSRKPASLPTSFSAGLCDEFLFRGFAISLLVRSGGGWKAKLVWSSLAFGFGHVWWGPVSMAFTTVLVRHARGDYALARQRVGGSHGAHASRPMH